MIKIVNAKINIGLNVIRRRPDGYHDLESIFYSVGIHNGTPECPRPFCDILEFIPATEWELKVTSDTIDCDIKKNLVWKAMMEMDGLGCQPHSVTLDKHLPSKAGLGGGSADASFTLSVLNSTLPNPLSAQELSALARKLGADCPFFLVNAPSIATGTGERLKMVEKKLERLWAVIVKSDEEITTAEAFAGITPSGKEGDLERLYSTLEVKDWKDFISNDFERSFLERFPHNIKIKEYLYSMGALYASMSGSGSAFYGIFKNREEAEEAFHGCTLPYKTIVKL